NYADKPDLTMREFVQTIRETMGLRGVGPRLPYAAGLAGGAAFDALAKISGRRFPISLVRVRKFCAHTVVNADRARGAGFEAPFALEDGLRVMMRSEFPHAKKAA